MASTPCLTIATCSGWFAISVHSLTGHRRGLPAFSINRPNCRSMRFSISDFRFSIADCGSKHEPPKHQGTKNSLCLGVLVVKVLDSSLGLVRFLRNTPNQRRLR
jgi:hypothetical protein